MKRNGMTIPAAIKLNGYEKHFDGFHLGPLEFEIPVGFTTALIGENGAGKTTLLDALGGITSGRGKITWLEKYTDLDQNDGEPRNEIGWCAANRFFPMTWSLKNIRKSLPLAFDNFDMEKFDSLLQEFGIEEKDSKHPKKISAWSDGNRARLAIASILARDTKLLILDEPDSALDPVIRDVLNSKFRQYINQGNGETSIIFSTHNIADMESIVDYVVFLARGRVIATGFVEDLREQYRYVHGPKDALGASKGTEAFDFYYFDDNKVEGLCSIENADKFDEGLAVEVPTLQQLSVLILRSGE
ncbi:ABC-2 type transport system ATP-binding protein [Treponema bryantii]|uniref:ABC-2 type transport system ATP-binding protein n=1 Tax=Treponema bryantii TaxID=163 RepID=A0A1H9JJT9_9SPIR|nr:ABC transporter ATP-binding protein [Treponema bryantii]SEQ86795.1 ABC-2 type transport system ATP-binding protein [Treponema bryantii]